MKRVYQMMLVGAAFAAFSVGVACGSQGEDYPIIPTDSSHIEAFDPTLIPTVTPGPTESLDKVVTEPETNAIPGAADPNPLPESTPNDNPTIPQQTLEDNVATAAPAPTPGPTYNPPESTPEPGPSPTPEATATPVPTVAPTSPAEASKPAATPEPTTSVIQESLETTIYNNLLSYVPEIKEFDNNEQGRRVINMAVVQIRDDIYNPSFMNPTGLAADPEVWNYISKAIGFILPELSNADLRQYSDMDLRQILLPTTLRTIDIKSILEGNRDLRYNPRGLEQGLVNVSPDDSLGGKSPQEVLRERIRDDYNNENSTGYEEAIYNSTGAALAGWPNSMGAFLEVREGMLTRGEDEPLFVIGWSGYKVGEQSRSAFASLVGRSMEEPLAAYGSSANYPAGKRFDGVSFSHGEPWVSYKGRLISAWMVEEKFLEDYKPSTWPDFKGELNKPIIILSTPDGLYNPFTLIPINPK